MAYEKDPRVAHFRACDAKEKQEQKKRKKLEKQRLEEEREEEERRRRAKLEAEQRALKEEKKLAQEEEQRAKKQLQSGRRQLRELAKSKGYFTSDSNEQLKVMEKIERVCIVGNFEELTEITDKLANVMDLDEALRLLSIKVVYRFCVLRSRSNTVYLFTCLERGRLCQGSTDNQTDGADFSL